jgi:hypothetical protein
MSEHPEYYDNLIADINRVKEMDTYTMPKPWLLSAIYDLRCHQKILNELTKWALSYPKDVFPEPDLIKAEELLKAGDMTLDSISACTIRHVMGRLNIIINAFVTEAKELKMKEIRGYSVEIE